MSEYTIKIVNCETGEEIVREMTPEEIAIRKADEKAHEEKKAIELAKIELERNRKAKLLALGLTEEELGL